MAYHELTAASITMLVHQFYDDVRGDAELFPIFEAAIGADWAPHLDRMVDFWATVMLGTKSFQGNVFGKHMLLQGVTSEHFVRWLAKFKAVSSRLFRPEIAAQFHMTAERIATSLEYGFFGEKDFAPPTLHRRNKLPGTSVI